MWQRYRRGVGLAAVGLLVVGLLVAGGLATRTAQAEPGGTNTQHGKYAQVFLDKLASLLNVERDKLTAAMKQAAGQTVDQAVANGDLTQKQADRMKSHIESGGFMMGGWGGGMGRGHGQGMMGVIDGQAVMAAVAQRLGLTTDQLHTELRSGKTLAQVATAHGVSTEDLRKTVLDTVTPQLDKAVQDGRITAQQRDAILDRIRQADFSGAHLGGMGMMGGGTGMHHDAHGMGGMSMPRAGMDGSGTGMFRGWQGFRGFQRGGSGS